MARNTTYNAVYVYRCALIKDRALKFNPGPVITTAAAAELITRTINEAGQSDREHMILVMLSAQLALLGVNIVSVGSVTSSPVCARELFKPVLTAGAAKIIIGHNHPCSRVRPSKEDKSVTVDILAIAMLLDVIVLDHIIVNTEDGTYFSFLGNYALSPLEAKAKQMIESMEALG